MVADAGDAGDAGDVDRLIEPSENPRYVSQLIDSSDRSPGKETAAAVYLAPLCSDPVSNREQENAFKKKKKKTNQTNFQSLLNRTFESSEIRKRETNKEGHCFFLRAAFGPTRHHLLPPSPPSPSTQIINNNNITIIITT